MDPGWRVGEEYELSPSGLGQDSGPQELQFFIRRHTLPPVCLSHLFAYDVNHTLHPHPLRPPSLIQLPAMCPLMRAPGHPALLYLGPHSIMNPLATHP